MRDLALNVLLIAGLQFVALAVAQDIPPYTEDCRNGTYPPPSTEEPAETFVLNLDISPDARWSPLIKKKAPAMKALVDDIIDLIAPFLKNVTKGIEFVDELFAPLAEGFPEPYKSEVHGVAKASGLPLGQVVLYNVFYEVFTFCTSIVAEDETGKLYHARNLDFGLFLGWDIKNKTWALTERLRPLIVNIDYQVKGKTVAKAVHFAGYLGVLTGVKPDVFTVSMNERFNLDGGYLGILEWILGDHNGKWMGFELRDTLVNAQSFDEAMHTLTTVEFLAPAYIILGGNKTGQGAIITRDRKSTADVKMMKGTDADWFLVQTNYDNWKDPPFFDDRRTPATKCMTRVTRKSVGLPRIFDVLSTKPVMNLLTTYTALMEVKGGHLETYIRHCAQPCWPW
ncbi:Acid ceramidase [Holothuria leucospilota]|uniref:Acid ceramidase n=1 Tax=Holothuria leucospilota TaxID=206669 RepID=A0A9Q1BKE0_HOLLE|nr:Acid ceramidase [Holothuria leucospilota]